MLLPAICCTLGYCHNFLVYSLPSSLLLFSDTPILQHWFCAHTVLGLWHLPFRAPVVSAFPATRRAIRLPSPATTSPNKQAFLPAFWVCMVLIPALHTLTLWIVGFITFAQRAYHCCGLFLPLPLPFYYASPFRVPVYRLYCTCRVLAGSCHRRARCLLVPFFCWRALLPVYLYKHGFLYHVYLPVRLYTLLPPGFLPSLAVRWFALLCAPCGLLLLAFI